MFHLFLQNCILKRRFPCFIHLVNRIHFLIQNIGLYTFHSAPVQSVEKCHLQLYEELLQIGYWKLSSKHHHGLRIYLNISARNAHIPIVCLLD